MSDWNPYINSVVEHSNGNCDEVCIVGLEDGKQWTTEAHPNCMKKTTFTETQAIVNCVKRGDFVPFQTSGVVIGGVKYQFLRGEPTEGLVLAKKKDKGAITIQKSGRTIVIGHTAEGKQQGTTNEAVQGVITHLQTAGF